MKCSTLFHAVLATAISVSLLGPVLARQGTKMAPNAKTMTIEGPFATSLVPSKIRLGPPPTLI